MGEIDRMQKVIFLVRVTLKNLLLAIDGTIIMSDQLRSALDSMYDARTPPEWAAISWLSSSLGFWYTELLLRQAQFFSWIFDGRPSTFWMTGFFNPNGFITAMRQEITRAHAELTEQHPKVLYVPLPIMWIFAVNSTAVRDARQYECPIYRKPRRTDQEYICMVDLKTKTNPDHWTLRGCALLCDIK